MPMRIYSAGMMLRLAFGISTAVSPEILILDEVIGAGDAAFMSRANDRLKSFVDGQESSSLPVMASQCYGGGATRACCSSAANCSLSVPSKTSPPVMRHEGTDQRTIMTVVGELALCRRLLIRGLQVGYWRIIK